MSEKEKKISLNVLTWHIAVKPAWQMDILQRGRPLLSRSPTEKHKIWCFYLTAEWCDNTPATSSSSTFNDSMLLENHSKHFGRNGIFQLCVLAKLRSIVATKDLEMTLIGLDLLRAFACISELLKPCSSSRSLRSSGQNLLTSLLLVLVLNKLSPSPFIPFTGLCSVLSDTL